MGFRPNKPLDMENKKKTVKQVYRGKIYQQRIDTVKRVELEFVVADYRIDSVIETIRNVTKTGMGADGRIYIFPLDNAIHIHSGSRHLGDSTEEGFFDEI
ncbi:MAG: P-II family nitrogen regulator [Candidatus Scalindua sp.]